MPKHNYSNTWKQKEKVGGSDVFHSATYCKFSKKDFETLKNLKSEKMNSYYIDTILTWKQEDNQMNDVKNIATTIHFFVRLVNIPENFIKKYNVKSYHISLLRRMYIEYDDDEKIAMMGYKRPYGNSNVLGDVMEEYEKYNKVLKYEDIPEEYINDIDYNILTDNDKEEIVQEYIYDVWQEKEGQEILLNIHNEVMDILEIMLKELELEYYEWESTGWGSWKPTKNEMRKKKLKNILK